MPDREQPDTPLWAAAKSRKTIDVVREAAKAVAQVERERATKPIAKLTEIDLEAEQLRLEEMLRMGTMTVDDFCRLREVDHYLESMRLRREYGSEYE